MLTIVPFIFYSSLARPTTADSRTEARQWTVSHLYDLWRNSNLGLRTGEGIWATLEEKLPKYIALSHQVFVGYTAAVMHTFIIGLLLVRQIPIIMAYVIAELLCLWPVGPYG